MLVIPIFFPMIPFILYRFVPGRVVEDRQERRCTIVFNPSLATDLFFGFPLAEAEVPVVNKP